MTADLPPPTTTAVIMGVSGSGKTVIARELAGQTGWRFAEGDDFHPPNNVARMRSGRALDDDDRWPWLRAIAAWIGEQECAGLSALVTCSALKREYRDLLRDGHPSVWFAHLTADPREICRRVERRQGHYMPPSLLGSQLATLRGLEDDEPGVTIANDRPAPEVAAHLLDLLLLHRVV